MQTGSSSSPWRNAFLTSNCVIGHCLAVATDKTIWMVDVLTTGLNISVKSIPSS